MAYAKDKSNSKPVATADKVVFVEKIGKDGVSLGFKGYVTYNGMSVAITVNPKIYRAENGRNAGKDTLYGRAAIFKQTSQTSNRSYKRY